MSDSGILQQAVRIEKVDRVRASHFALCNGDKIRYLIAFEGGRKRLSSNISTYSGKLGLLMKLLDYIPFMVLNEIKLGYYVKVNLHNEIEKEICQLKPDAWNMIVGTYDEKQKLVLQCYWKDNPIASFVKIGNEATEKEMISEINFLKTGHDYQSFEIPIILGSKVMSEDCPFNMLVTKEFVGRKVAPELTTNIIEIYEEISSKKKIVDGIEYEFSHGDFAPWNIKRNRNQYMVFDWEHCGYRVKGFDLMHYVTIVEMDIYGKSLEEAFERGLEKINQLKPSFSIDKKAFLDEFRRLRKQIE